MRKHNYVVGFLGDNQVVYGKNDSGHGMWATPVTFKQAQRRMRELSETTPDVRRIFKLVEVLS